MFRRVPATYWYETVLVPTFLRVLNMAPMRLCIPSNALISATNLKYCSVELDNVGTIIGVHDHLQVH